MASIEIAKDKLVVTIHGIDILLAMKFSVEFPLEHVVGIRADPPEANFDAAVIDPSVGTGVFIGGKLAMGTVQLADGVAFYEVRDNRHAIAIDLRNEHLKHVVVELEDETPEAAASRLQSALAEYRSRHTLVKGDVAV